MYAQQNIAVKPDHRWIPVEKDEMKAFLGLRIYMSTENLPETRMCWAKDRLFGNFGTSHVMTRDRFDKISQYFHANDRSQMPFNAQGKPVDKLYLFSSVHFIYFTISCNIHFVTLQPKYQPTTDYTEKERIVQTYIRAYLMLYIRYFDCKGEQEKLD